MKHKVLNILKKYAVITFGCIVYSIGVALFLDLYNIAAGGVTGIAIVLNYLVHMTELQENILDTATRIIIINIPLFILGAIFFGRKFILSTLYSTIVSSLMMSLWTYLLSDYMPEFSNKLLPAVIGGTLFGIGLGIIFRMGSTTGGTDIVVKILRKKFRYIRTGVISLIIDVIIVCISGVVYKDFELLCYTVISIVIFSMVFDWMLYGGNSAKLIYIISEHEKSVQICQRILTELDIGATYVDGEGAYTGDKKRIVMCAIKNFTYPKLRDIVKEIDPKAFMIVSSAKEIYGEGYKNHTDDEL